MLETLRETAFAVSVWALPALIAITFHEAAHGYAAERFGDPTARRAGRVSLNPARHIDPFGTVVLPLALIALTSVAFGYAKPVPVNFLRLSPARIGAAVVALAGPAANIALAVAAGLLLHLAAFAPDLSRDWIEANLVNALILNVILALFNMVPLLPLDGGRVLHACLPPAWAKAFARSERLGFPILLGVLVGLPLAGRLLDVQTGIFGWFLGGPVQYVVSLIATMTGAT